MATAPRAQPTGLRPAPMTQRVVVRCCSTYGDAKRTVDRLAVAGIPPKRIIVMGRGFSWREMFTLGRLTEAAMGAGAVVAAASALALWFAGGLDGSLGWFEAMIAGSVLGGALGVPLGAGTWLAAHANEALPETGHVVVDHYCVLVEVSHADRARELLKS